MLLYLYLSIVTSFVLFSLEDIDSVKNLSDVCHSLRFRQSVAEACFRNIIHSISPVFKFDAKVAGNGHNVRNDSTEDCDGFTDDDRIKEVK